MKQIVRNTRFNRIKVKFTSTENFKSVWQSLYRKCSRLQDSDFSSKHGEFVAINGALGEWKNYTIKSHWRH